MRMLLLVAMVAAVWIQPTLAQDAQQAAGKSAADAIFEELSVALPAKGQWANSARLELRYWHERSWPFPDPVRKTVTTKDGRAAEVVFLNRPAMGMPDEDFSMAFLFVETRLVDWTSCSTYNRTANHELLLEDVDGDGNIDVAFRASAGFFGLLDERQHSLPGDNRKWLYAYTITTQGFQSIFPETERDLKLKSSFDVGKQPISLQVLGLPETLRERQWIECTLSATNTSGHELVVEPGKWFDIAVDVASMSMRYAPPDKRTHLKPGETISQVICLRLDGVPKDATIIWRFVPTQAEPKAKVRSVDSPCSAQRTLRAP